MPAVNVPTGWAAFGTMSPLAGPAALAGDVNASAANVPAAAVAATETTTRRATCRTDIKRLLLCVYADCTEGDCSANCSARHMLSDTSAGPPQAKMPGDTNKTSSGCMPVPCPSPTVHLSCKSPWNAPTFIGPPPCTRPPVFAGDSSWVTVTDRDRPGHIDRVYGVTEVSTKGLLPQLTDVLHALTGSHSLLLGTIQSVRLEHISAVASGGEEQGISDGAPWRCGPGWASPSKRRRRAVGNATAIDEVEQRSSSRMTASSIRVPNPRHGHRRGRRGRDVTVACIGRNRSQ